MGRGKSSSIQEASKPRPRTAKDQLNANANDDDNELEEGRSSLGKPKRRKMAAEKKKRDMVNEDRTDSAMKDKEGMDESADRKSTKTSFSSSAREEATGTSSRGPVRFGTYLDVHKAEKRKKKKRLESTKTGVLSPSSLPCTI